MEARWRYAQAVSRKQNLDREGSPSTGPRRESAGLRQIATYAAFGAHRAVCVDSARFSRGQKRKQSA